MDDKKVKRLNQLESILYIVITVAIVADILSNDVHTYLFVFSTIVLVAGIVGIIYIESLKLYWKQRKGNTSKK